MCISLRHSKVGVKCVAGVRAGWCVESSSCFNPSLFTGFTAASSLLALLTKEKKCMQQMGRCTLKPLMNAPVYILRLHVYLF